MQKNIIISLVILILIISLFFLIKENKNLKEDKKQLQDQITSIAKHQQDNLEDLEARNKEIINNKSKINDLQKQLKIKNKENDCINAIVPDEFLDMLQDNNSNK